MNYRSLNDLNEDVKRNLWRVPRDADVIVGVPRSGMLVANLMALHLNLPLTDVEGLIAGRLLQSGSRRASHNTPEFFGRLKKVVVVDDSVLSGAQLSKTKERLAVLGTRFEFVFGAAYVDEASQFMVDFHFAQVPPPRLFEWNLMHHPGALAEACVDIDGVLCVDPTHEQNDDAERYAAFLDSARTLLRPSARIGWLVTSRLEKYRAATARWLQANGVEYGELVMLDLPNAEMRRRAGVHGSFKGRTYKALPATLFIESDPSQAREIAAVSGKPVLCVADGRVREPSFLEAPVHLWHRVHRQLRVAGRGLKHRYLAAREGSVK